MIICQSQHEVGEVIQKSHVGKCYYGRTKRSEGNTPSTAITCTTKSTLLSLSTSFMLMSSILWLINWNLFFLLVVLSNAEGNKITVAEAGGVQLKIFPHVLANKVGYLLSIFKNSNNWYVIYHLPMINLHYIIIPFQARQILLWWQRFKLLFQTIFWEIR